MANMEKPKTGEENWFGELPKDEASKKKMEEIFPAGEMTSSAKRSETDTDPAKWFEESAKEKPKQEVEFFPVEKSKPLTEEDIFGMEASKKKEADKQEVQKRLDQLDKELKDIFSGKDESEVASANEIEEARKRLEKEAA